MAARRMLRAFFRAIGWNVAACVALGLFAALIEALGDGTLMGLSLGLFAGLAYGVVLGVPHGVVQALVALVREPHRRTVSSALAAGVSASLVTWLIRADPVPVTELVTRYAPYVLASPFLARWCHPVGGRR